MNARRQQQLHTYNTSCKLDCMPKLTRIGMPRALLVHVNEYAAKLDVSPAEAIKRFALVGDMAKTRYEELRRSIIMYDSENHEGIKTDEHTLHVTIHNMLDLIFKEFENFDWTESLSFDVEFEHVMNIRFEQIAKEEKDDIKNVVALRTYVGWSLIMKCSKIQSEHALDEPRNMVEERLAKFAEYCIKHIIEPCMSEKGTRSS